MTHPAQWDGLKNIQQQWGRLKGGLAKRSALFQRKRVGWWRKRKVKETRKSMDSKYG